MSIWDHIQVKPLCHPQQNVSHEPTQAAIVLAFNKASRNNLYFGRTCRIGHTGERRQYDHKATTLEAFDWEIEEPK